MKHYLIEKIEYAGQNIIDLFNRYIFLQKFEDDVRYYKTYMVIDGESPEVISNKLYGDPKWWWVILLFNRIEDPFFDWIMTTNEVEDYARKIIINTYGTTVGYEAELLDKINEISENNENRREIKILKQEYLGTLVKQLRGWIKQ